MNFAYSAVTKSFSFLSIDMGRFLGETLVGESLSPIAEMQRAGLLGRLQPHLRQSGGDVTSIPKINEQEAEINGK